MSKINDKLHAEKPREFWLDPLLTPPNSIYTEPSETCIHVREVVPGLDERWREKYYDKCGELNKAEAEIARLKSPGSVTITREQFRKAAITARLNPDSSIFALFEAEVFGEQK